MSHHHWHRGGRLIDGQHRCRAALASGCAFPTLVVANIDETSFDTLDIGRQRGFDEVLAPRGELHVSALSSATRLLWMMQIGQGEQKRASIGDLLEYLATIPALRESVRQFLTRVTGLRRSTAIALHFIFAQENPSKATEFFSRLRNGANLDVNSPILLLRNRLLEALASPSPVSEREKMALTIKAWRAFVADRPLRTLTWACRGPNAETFPELKWPIGLSVPRK